MSRAATEPTWNFNNDLQGWSVTAGVHAFEGAGIEPAQDNGTRAHDAAHSVFVLTSPEINFNLTNVSAVDNVIDILWEGGKGNQDKATERTRGKSKARPRKGWPQEKINRIRIGTPTSTVSKETKGRIRANAQGQ